MNRKLPDSHQRDGLTLDAAKRRKGELRARCLKDERSLRGALDAERAAKEAAAEAAKVSAAAKRAHALGNLLEAYGEQLERDGKPSAHKVRLALCRSVREAWSKL